jgi:hypothetical protein
MLQQITMLLPLTCILVMMMVVAPAFAEHDWTPATVNSIPIFLFLDFSAYDHKGYHVYWITKLPVS